MTRNKKILVSVLGGLAVVAGLALFISQPKTAKGQYGGPGSLTSTEIQATCTVKPGSIVAGSGEAATFDVNVTAVPTTQNGYSQYVDLRNYSFTWTYPKDIANCDASPYFDECTTGPVSRTINPGEFAIQIKDETSQYGQTVYASCPGVPLVMPAVITTNNLLAIGPYGNKDGSHYCPAGTIGIGFGHSYGGSAYQNVPLLCATLNATGTALINSNYSNGTTGGIDSSQSGGQAWCGGGNIIAGAEWAKNGQIDFGRCVTPDSGLVLRSGYKAGEVSGYAASKCKQGYVPVGFANYPSKNDAWGSVYCSQTFVPVSATAGGKITVTSENSVVTSTRVSSSWYFPAYPSTDPCSVASCSGITSAYPNMPLGSYTLLASSTSAGPTFTLRSVELRPIAKGPENSFLSLISDFLGKAEAYTVCGWNIINGDAATSTCPNSSPSLGINNSGNTANFIILWDPIAAITASPSSVSLNAPTGSVTSTQLMVKNSGGTASTLSWTASSSTPWLSVWPTSGCLNAGGKTVNGCSDTNGYKYLTLTANDSSLASGTYTGAVTFSGTSQPVSKNVASTTIAVTFTVDVPPSSPSQPPPSCTFGASPQQIVPPETSTLSWTCQHATSCQLDGVPVSTNGSKKVSPTTDTTYTLSCEGSGSGPTNTVTTQTTVTAGGPNVHEVNP